MQCNCFEIALLARLIFNGAFIETTANQQLRERFQVASWIQKGRRKSEWVIRESAREEIKKRLEHLLPAWEENLLRLRQMGRNPCNPSDIEALSALIKVPPRKALINRRNWEAVSGPGPKRAHKRVSEDTLTSDWALRLRPSKGLCAYFGDKLIDLSEIADSLTESVIPERGWMRIKAFAGVLPKCIITCENLGAFIDFPEIEGACIVHSPGKNIGPAVNVLRAMPDSAWLHFGDIDPEGVNIAKLMGKRSDRPAEIYVPSFLADYDNGEYQLKAGWGDIGRDLVMIERLRASNRGILQEHFMLDKRLACDINKRVTGLVKPRGSV